jgi:hypothetical protein
MISAVFGFCLRTLLALLGLILIALGLFASYFLAIARIDGRDDLDYAMLVDVYVGGMIAVGVALLCFIATPKFLNSAWWWVPIVGSIAIWMFVSGILIYGHRWQFHLHSSPPIDASITRDES